MRLQTRFLRALLHIYKRHKQKSANLTRAHCLATARHTVSKTPFLFSDHSWILLANHHSGPVALHTIIFDRLGAFDQF